MVFPLACIVAAAIVLVSETAYWQSVERLQRVNALTKSQDSLQRLTQGIVDAETGTRGFLLTGGPEYLEPYQAALGKITLAMQQVDQRFSADPASADLLEKLHEFTRSKLSELQLTIQLVEQGKAGAT
ncbi:MAG: CHASE3 domain-containing protein, partial [Burkholderiaceae bacterium]